ncbi:non-homologous end joining protein Ku [Cumulibacter manganitolerans]|uniref:non-homologous end joining protein Ku n=1 Tax=Cumulibacter manganitolerans TaxID=1884992 RepID=UPI001297E27D|nr:Ku protein [Cumulibacter manganitolerans]
MRSIWKGAIAFGLVNVPVKMYSATENHDAPLHQVHDEDGGRIRYQRRCEKCNEIVEFAHIDKAYVDGDRTIVLTDADFSMLPSEQSHEIEVVEFVPRQQVPVELYSSTYYLEPDSKSAKAYVLLRRALQETDRLAIVKFAMRQRTRLAALRVKDDVLVLQSLLWPDEVREADFASLGEEVKVSAAELKMAAQLVDSLATDFEPEKFTDDYQVQLRQLIDAKIEQGDTIDTEATFGAQKSADEGEVIDLMEALRRSIETKRSGASTDASAEADGGSETEDETAAAEEEAPAPRKKPAKKAPAKKAAAKKAPAKKTAARRKAAS